MQEQRARAARRRRRRPLALSLFFLSPKMKFGRFELISSIVSSFKAALAREGLGPTFRVPSPSPNYLSTLEWISSTE